MLEKIIKENENAWDKRAANGDRWSTVVSAEKVAQARKGDWHIIVTPEKPVPRSWFPETLAGKKVLCLASGGGQQGPILAATGADVTVFDNSTGQLELKYSIPYADIDHLDDPKVREITQAEGYSWGHPIEEQIQGQISAGFVIAGFYEDRGCWMFDNYINTSMATKAVKV